MSILVIFTAPGIDQDAYDMLRREVGWEHQYPAGALLHAASFDETGGAHVVDVWESPEALDAFVGQRLGPALQKHHLTPPEVAAFPLHNLNAFAGIEPFLLR